MQIPKRITEQLQQAPSRKEALKIILDECCSGELINATLDWCIKHRHDLILDD
jgi:hypothetical protein